MRGENGEGRERKEIGVEGKLVPFGLSIGLNSPPL